MATDGIRHAPAPPRVSLRDLAPTVSDERSHAFRRRRQSVLLQLRREHEHELVLPQSTPPLSGYALVISADGKGRKAFGRPLSRPRTQRSTTKRSCSQHRRIITRARPAPPTPFPRGRRGLPAEPSPAPPAPPLL